MFEPERHLQPFVCQLSLGTQAFHELRGIKTCKRNPILLSLADAAVRFPQPPAFQQDCSREPEIPPYICTMSSGGIFQSGLDRSIANPNANAPKYTIQCKLVGTFAVVIILSVALGLGLGVGLASKHRLESVADLPSSIVNITAIN